MDYKIVLTIDAESQLDAFIRYLLFEKKNEQAGMNPAYFSFILILISERFIARRR